VVILRHHDRLSPLDFVHAVQLAKGMYDKTSPRKRSQLCDEARLGDSPPNFANALESQSCASGLMENVVGLQGVQRKLARLYHQKYSVSNPVMSPGWRV